MTYQSNNWLHYILVFALMLLPLQNGWAAVSSVPSTPVEIKQVCHEMGEHHQPSAQQMDMQQHTVGCCDKDMNCQQQCADCLHCPGGVAALTYYNSYNHQAIEQLVSIQSIYPDTLPPSSHIRPPRI